VRPEKQPGDVVDQLTPIIKSRKRLLAPEWLLKGSTDLSSMHEVWWYTTTHQPAPDPSDTRKGTKKTRHALGYTMGAYRNSSLVLSVQGAGDMVLPQGRV
jgi:hypothetical protein